MDYKFNTWRVSGEQSDNVLTKEQHDLISGGLHRPVLSDGDLTNVLYLFHVKGMTYKEITKHIAGVRNSITIKCIVQGRYKTGIDVYTKFMEMKEKHPEQLERLFEVKTYTS